MGAGDPSHRARATRTFPAPPAQGSLREADLAPPPAFAVAARGGPIGARDRGPRPARGREERGGRNTWCTSARTGAGPAAHGAPGSGRPLQLLSWVIALPERAASLGWRRGGNAASIATGACGPQQLVTSPGAGAHWVLTCTPSLPPARIPSLRTLTKDTGVFH